MSNLNIMKQALNRAVIGPLREQGFVGAWPHFKRLHADHIELLTFQTNRYGGSFTVEMSAVFPFAANKNYTERDGFSLDNIHVWDTNERYRLKGMYHGWFHYQDLYRKYIVFLGTDYVHIGEKEADAYVPPKGYRLVQEFNSETAEKICHCVNQQLKQGFSWMDRFVKRNLHS